MFGLRTCVAAGVLVGLMGVAGHAQGVVSGGWATGFGYQAFGNSGFAAGGPNVGFGGPAYGGMVSPYGFGGVGFYGGGVSPYGMGYSPYGLTRPYYAVPYGSPMSTTVNAMNPLMNAIGTTVRSSRR